MPDGGDTLTIKVLHSLATIEPIAWDRCAGPDDPFMRHAFLYALEKSGSASAETGWAPHHLVIEGPDGGLLAAAPVYLKNHSYGEYVFDWGWADAFERAGGAYYPKLQCSVPFTPVTGRRLLVRDDLPEGRKNELMTALAAGMVELARKSDASSVHITFPTEQEWTRLGDLTFVKRVGQQYHWENRGYGSFDDFLGDLTSRKRKQIRKERKKVADLGLDIRILTGDTIEERHWDAFYRFYRSTSDKKWGPSYLTRSFFSMIGEEMGDDIALVYVEDDGQPVAGALNLIGGEALFGRNWGCLKTHKFLHFEACYYRAIDFAIERGLARVEAGAQGPHKVQRGYIPNRTYSAHWFADAGLGSAIGDFVQRERRGVEYEIAMMMEDLPFRNGEND